MEPAKRQPKIQCFNSTTRRFSSKTVDGPPVGSYEDPRRAFAQSAHANPQSGRKQFAAPFGNSSTRFVEADPKKALPGPGRYTTQFHPDYSIQGKVASSINYHSPAVFGGTEQRVLPLANRDAHELPGPAQYESKVAESTKPAAIFVSKTPRVAPPSNLDTPTPTQYNVAQCRVTLVGACCASYPAVQTQTAPSKIPFNGHGKRFQSDALHPTEVDAPAPNVYSSPSTLNKAGM